MNIIKALELAACMKLLVTEQKQLDKHNVIARDFNNTKARRDRAHAAGNACAIEIRRLMHESHCVAVELGISPRREPSYYTSSTAPAGMGRTVIFDRREPADEVQS